MDAYERCVGACGFLFLANVEAFLEDLLAIFAVPGPFSPGYGNLWLGRAWGNGVFLERAVVFHWSFASLQFEGSPIPDFTSTLSINLSGIAVFIALEIFTLADRNQSIPLLEMFHAKVIFSGSMTCCSTADTIFTLIFCHTSTSRQAIRDILEFDALVCTKLATDGPAHVVPVSQNTEVAVFPRAWICYQDLNVNERILLQFDLQQIEVSNSHISTTEQVLIKIVLPSDGIPTILELFKVVLRLLRYVAANDDWLKDGSTESSIDESCLHILSFLLGPRVYVPQIWF